MGFASKNISRKVKFHKPGLFLLIIISILGASFNTPYTALARPLMDAAPSISLNVPPQVMLGESFSFDIIFDNTGDQPGYGPFIDVVFPNNGADGAAGTETPDGISFNATLGATYGGVQLTCESNTFVSGEAEHPFYRDSSGAYHIMQGITGDTIVSCLLPFGSVVPAQPPTAVTFNALLSDLADVGTSLPIRARGGFMFGADPLDNWCCDVIAPNPITNNSSLWIGPNQADVTPTIIALTKGYSGPENETATGPNFPRQFTITVDVAEGQTVTNLDVSDLLPGNVQFNGNVVTQIHGVDVLAIDVSTPSTTSPGGNVTRRFSSVVGTASVTDITMAFDFYIPRDDDTTARVINQLTGNDVPSPNEASALGDWTPIDTPRDPGGIDNVSAGVPGTPEYTLTDKSIAIQKGHTNLTGGGYSPGDLIEYTLDIQISDFFAFEDLVVTDVISDGQHVDSTFTPTLAITGNNGYILATTNLTRISPNFNYDISCNYSGTQGSECTDSDSAVDDGKTKLVFRLSDELAFQRGDNGKLIGGCIPPAGGTADCTTHNDGATTATITYRTLILEDFVDFYPSGDSSVDQGDTFRNDVILAGDILDNPTLLSVVGSETDDSDEGFAIGRDTLEKYVFAINGSTGFATPIHVKPGDEITFQLIYNLTTSDVEDLAITDYLPLPVLNVDDFDADGAGGDSWGWPTGLDDKCTSLVGTENIGIPLTDFVPASGLSCINSGDTFTDYSGIVPTLTANIPANSLRFEYGDYDNPADLARKIDILFTITVNNEPYADGLFFTNQSEVFEGSTNSTDQSTDTIIDFILDEPFLVLDKGAIASSNTNAIFDPDPPGPGPIPNFSPPGTTIPAIRWTGIIGSDALAATPISSAIRNVDAGDLVSFALIIENQGNSDRGAFDIQIKDIIPLGFSIPSAPPGLNLTIYRGDRSSPTAYTGLGGGPDSIAGTDDDLFGNGLEITDSGTTGACQKYHVSDGSNIFLIIYDLEVDADIDPEVELENLGTVYNYANIEDGPDFTGDDADLTASTTTTIAVPGVDKNLIDTGLNETNNDDTQAVIGETIQYEVELTIPEGEMLLANLIDDLEEGLRFVSLDSLVISTPATPQLISSVDTSGAHDFSNTANFNPAVSGTGAVGDPQTLTFNFGSLTNSNRDNTIPETITLTYTVLVLNVISSQHADLLSNAAYLAWDEDGDASTAADAHQTAVSSADVIVIEPQINVIKSVVVDGSGNRGDAGDSVVYTVEFTANAVRPTAYEVVLSDILSDDIDFSTGSFGITSVTDPGGGLVIGDFEIAAGNELKLVSSSIDMAPGRVITITLEGELKDTVFTGQDIINNAVLTWTSMSGLQNSGLENGERTGENGSGGLNDYESTGSVLINIIEPSPQKSIVTTSEAHTGTISGVPRLVIGEIVRYRLEIRLAEGTSNDLIIRDNLPAGLIFVNDGTAKVIFVSTDPIIGDIDSQITADGDALAIDDSTAFTEDSTPLSSIVPVYVLPDQNISNLLTGNNDTYISGTYVYFKLGNVFNGEIDPDGEYAVVEFNALIANAGVNQAGTTQPNTFSVFVDVDGDGNAEAGEIVETSSPVDVIIAEPIQSLTKTMSTLPADAGDTVRYTLVLSNNETGNNDATAFDLTLTDTFDTYLNSIAVDSVVTTQGITCTGNGVGTTPFNHDGGNFSGQDFTFTATCLDPGRTITVIISAVLENDVPAGYNLLNSADLTWTSLPGEKGTSANPTGSNVDDSGTTEDDSGGSRGERNGSETPAVNDYATNDNDQYTLDVPVPVKSIVSTTETHTSEAGDGSSGNPRDLAIGEIIRYRLTISLPEGINTNLSMTDTLPAGFTYLGNATVIFLADNDMGEDSDLASADPVIDALPPTFPMPGSRINVSGQTVTFTLGTLDNNDINDGDQEYAVVDFDVRVNNDANNNNTDLDNNDFDVLLNGAVVGTSNQVGTRIVEPLLNISKAASNIQPTYGETYTYTITVDNLVPSLSAAFDIEVIDVIPSELTYLGGSAGPAGWLPSYNAGTTTLTWTCALPCSSPVGTSVDLTYQVTVASVPAPPAPAPFPPGTVITNTPIMTWTSLDDDNSNLNQRTGTGAPAYNDYHDSTSEDVTITNPDLRVTKTDGTNNYIPGTTTTYTILVSNQGNKDVSNATVTDARPSQISTWNWTCVETVGASGCNPTTPPGAQTPLDFSDQVNLSVGSSITYTVLATIPSGSSGPMTNTVTVAMPAGVAEPTPIDNTATDVDGQDSHADLAVDKDDGVTIISAGTTLTYLVKVENTSPSDVTGATVTDPIPAEIVSWTWDCTAFSGGASGCTTAASNSSNFTDTINLPAHSSITYTVTAQVSPTASGTLTNEVTVSVPPGVTEDDITNNTDDDVDAFAEHNKILDSLVHNATTQPDVAIGEILNYEITLTVPEGTMPNLLLVDTLDQGLAYVTCVSMTGPGLTVTSQVDLTAVCANPTVSTYPAGSPDQEDIGRQVEFDFGTLGNATGGTVDLIVAYQVVVLDSLANQDGSTPPLNNQAVWTWDSSQLTDQATGVVILEPDMTVTKTVDSPVIVPGQTRTFTIRVEHTAASHTPGFEVELSDIIPPELDYVPPIRHVGGLAPTTIIDGVPPDITIQWAVIDNTGVDNYSELEIDVVLDSSIRRRHYNQPITNEVSLLWSSLPGDFSTPQSTHNTLSTERDYDPLSNIDIYGVGDGVTIRVPALPDTGFAPGRTTPLPVQTEDKLYGDLDGMRVEIPKLGISLPIVSVPQSDQGWDLTWLWNQAGWLEGTAYPSWIGNTVITGHAYLSTGLPGPFVDLVKLSWGDEIFLYVNGLKYTYQVRVRNLVSADDLSILSHKDLDWITLFTCKEYSETINGYVWRQVVQAVMVDVEQVK